MCLSRKIDTASAEMRGVLNDITDVVHNSSMDLQAATARVNLEPREFRSRLDGITDRVNVIENDTSTTRSIAVQMCSETMESLALAQQTSLDVRCLTDEWQKLGTSVGSKSLLISCKYGNGLTTSHFSLHSLMPS